MLTLQYVFICSNTYSIKQLLKQLHEQDNKSVINSADSCSMHSDSPTCVKAGT